MKIVITGAKHSGKSTLARALASRIGVLFYDTDDLIIDEYERTRGAKLSIRDIYTEFGEEKFRQCERRVCKDVSRHGFCVIATGGGVALDGECRTTLLPGSITIHLLADEDLLWERIEKNGIPSFYQGPDGRDKHRERVKLINEVMRPRADLLIPVTRENIATLDDLIYDRVQEVIECMMRSPSSFGELVRVTTFGESHGPAVGCVLDGVSPGIPLEPEDVQYELDRRRPGQSAVSTQRKESDKVKFLSGVFEGRTTGHPICMVVMNEDHQSSAYNDLRDLFRPGHADFTFWRKYGLRDHRGGGRSSGRETIGRVASGAVAKRILLEKDVTITAFAEEIGSVRGVKEDFSFIEKNPVRAADPDMVEKMQKAIFNAQEKKDSVGGIVKIVVTGLPEGLGDPVFFKLDARLASAWMSLGAVKGIEFGSGFLAARLTGSTNNDQMTPDTFETNNSGGILGGISNGDDIIARIAVKPTPSIAAQQHTIDKSGNPRDIEVLGRHDPCIVPRIIPVVESMTALVLLDAWEIQERLRT